MESIAENGATLIQANSKIVTSTATERENEDGEERPEPEMPESDVMETVAATTLTKRKSLPRNRKGLLGHLLSSTPPPVDRSSAPSPTISLAQSVLRRRSLNAPPNTPAVHLGEPILGTSDEELSRPASPGELSFKIGSVKTTRTGASRDRPSASAPGALRKRGRTPRSRILSALPRTPDAVAEGNELIGNNFTNAMHEDEIGNGFALGAQHGKVAAKIGKKTPRKPTKRQRMQKKKRLTEGEKLMAEAAKVLEWQDDGKSHSK